MSIWNTYQHYRISQTNRRISGVEEANEVRHKRRANDVEDLEQRVERLIMVNHALWRLVQEHTGLTDEALALELTVLDGQDGSADGRRRVMPGTCRPCGAKVNAQATKCVFCGAPAPERSVFDTI